MEHHNVVLLIKFIALATLLLQCSLCTENAFVDEESRSGTLFPHLTSIATTTRSIYNYHLSSIPGASLGNSFLFKKDNEMKLALAIIKSDYSTIYRLAEWPIKITHLHVQLALLQPTGQVDLDMLRKCASAKLTVDETDHFMIQATAFQANRNHSEYDDLLRVIVQNSWFEALQVHQQEDIDRKVLANFMLRHSSSPFVDYSYTVYRSVLASRLSSIDRIPSAYRPHALTAAMHSIISTCTVQEIGQVLSIGSVFNHIPSRDLVSLALRRDDGNLIVYQILLLLHIHNWITNCQLIQAVVHAEHNSFVTEHQLPFLMTKDLPSIPEEECEHIAMVNVNLFDDWELRLGDYCQEYQLDMMMLAAFMLSDELMGASETRSMLVRMNQDAEVFGSMALEVGDMGAKKAGL